MFERKRKNTAVNDLLDEIMQRLDTYEARLKALEAKQPRGENGRFTSAKGAVRNVTGSE